MSGTHGTEDGASALTDIDRIDVDDGNQFYQEDCRKVGVKAGPSRRKTRPPLSLREPFSEVDWMKLPDITKPAERISPPPPDSLYSDELMKRMDIRVGHTIYYYKNKEKLIEDIKKVKG